MSRVLLDTHALLWWWTDDRRLSGSARAAIADRNTDVLVSAASAWEIATKARLGKLADIPAVTDRYSELMTSHGFIDLGITAHHALVAGDYSTPHRDPFDRLLAAQSQLERVPLITTDPAFAGFPVAVLW